jgi:lipid-A-disaccharide synthase
MKYYIIAGEASGDLHASRLIRAIRKNDPQADFRAWGGDLMAEEGAKVVKHYRDLAFMGFAEVVANIRTILANMKFCKRDMLAYCPDLVILVDYPGFNIPIAKFAHENQIKTAYYISPQVWAWKEGRVKTLRKVIDKMLVILPFEKDFYAKHAYEVSYVGHPLIEIIEGYRINQNNIALKEKLGIPNNRKIVALLPGSRKQEIEKKLPVMLQAAEGLIGDITYVIGQAPGISDEFIQQFIYGKDIRTLKNDTYGLLSVADAAIVTSGTATLETALFEVPEVVCYKGSPISFAIAKRIIKIRFISLVNLIMNKEVVKELIQDDMNSGNIKKELQELLFNPEKKAVMLEDFRQLKKVLYAGGSASENAAAQINDLLKEGCRTTSSGSI